MKKEIYKAMEEFTTRVLNGEKATPQETAILPEILKILMENPAE